MMTHPILFSIVIPTYNRAHILPKTIASILSQTYPHFEVIIVDDGSTDNTESVIKNISSDKIFYYKKENAERAAARNFGTSKAQGDYINWFDSDDIMFPDHLQQAVVTIQKYGNPEILALPYRHQTPDGKILGVFKFSSNVNADLLNGNLIGNSPVIVRRDIALASPYNEDRDLSGSEDYELWLRLASRHRIYSSPDVTVGSIYHDANSTVTMNDSEQLVKRYTKFIHYTTSNQEVSTFLGKHKKTFLMKNYLLLALDLAISDHRGLSKKYLSRAFKNSANIIFERSFYAYLKHTIRNVLSSK